MKGARKQWPCLGGLEGFGSGSDQPGQIKKREVFFKGWAPTIHNVSVITGKHSFVGCLKLFAHKPMTLTL